MTTGVAWPRLVPPAAGADRSRSSCAAPPTAATTARRSPRPRWSASTPRPTSGSGSSASSTSTTCWPSRPTRVSSSSTPRSGSGPERIVELPLTGLIGREDGPRPRSSHALAFPEVIGARRVHPRPAAVRPGRGHRRRLVRARRTVQPRRSRPRCRPSRRPSSTPSRTCGPPSRAVPDAASGRTPSRSRRSADGLSHVHLLPRPRHRASTRPERSS